MRCILENKGSLNSLVAPVLIIITFICSLFLVRCSFLIWVSYYSHWAPIKLYNKSLAVTFAGFRVSLILPFTYIWCSQFCLTWKVAVSSASALGTEDETEQVAETRPRPREERARCSNMALMLAGDCCVTETRDKEIMREITDHLSYLLQNGEHSTSWQCNGWSASMQFSGSTRIHTKCTF